MKKGGYRNPLIPKHELTKIFIRSLLLTAVAYLFLAPLTINRQATFEVYKGLKDGVGECYFDKQYDAIGVLGAGSSQNEDGTSLPAPFSIRRLDATKLLVENGISDNVILLDGYQGQEADPNTNKNYLREILQELPDENIDVDPNSTSTSTNVDSAEKISDEKGYEDVAFVTDDFHKTRTGIILEIKNVKGCVFTVELVNERYDPNNMDNINNGNNEDGSAWRKFMEKIKTFSLLYDTQGHFTASVERFFIKLLEK